MDGANIIAGRPVPGSGAPFASLNPATGAPLWQGDAASDGDVAAAVAAARAAFDGWSRQPVDARIAAVEAFGRLLEQDKAALARTVAEETGKPLWDAEGEVVAMARKVDLSVTAYHARTGTSASETGGIRSRLTHRPHGVLAVFGPYNFPGHLPNGHMVPALIAGNTVVFKPSELTPLVGQRMIALWQRAGLPAGVVNLVHGAKDTGVALAGHDGIDGLLFTGSPATGLALARQLADRPDKILALEMGGNNPLIVHGVADIAAAAVIAIQSAFITSGQRCTCARRLIVPEGAAGDGFVDVLCRAMDGIRIGAFDDADTPFMGPLIGPVAVDRVLAAQDRLEQAGGRVLRRAERLDRGPAFLTPGLMDVTGVADRPDEEVFGPFLQLIRTADFDAALAEANATRFGLAAGLLSDDRACHDAFYPAIRAGVVNWNQPLTGASSAAPFGGIGLSGNHRPSAYYAADYCAHPVASLEAASDKVSVAAVPKGLTLEEGA